MAKNLATKILEAHLVEGELVPESSHEMSFSQRRIVDARVLEFLKKTPARERAIAERSVA